MNLSSSFYDAERSFSQLRNLRRARAQLKQFLIRKKKNYLGTDSLDKIRLLKVVMSLTVREVLYRDKRLLAEKIGPPTCQIIRNSAEGIVLSVYKACRHIFCIVSHFLFGRTCVLHKSKELRPNHYNETFSTTNRYVIPAVWYTICSAYKLSQTLW